jgi:hypothetical protein
VFGPAPVEHQIARHHRPSWSRPRCARQIFDGALVLPETRYPGAATATKRPRLNQWSRIGRPTIRLLVLVFFLATFCFTFETTVGLLVVKNFNRGFHRKAHRADVMNRQKFGDAASTVLFVHCGLVSARAGRSVGTPGETSWRATVNHPEPVCPCDGLVLCRPFTVRSFPGARFPNLLWFAVVGLLMALAFRPRTALTRPPLLACSNSARARTR